MNSLPRWSKGTKGLSPWVPTMLTDTLSQVPAPKASPVDTLTLNLVILLTSQTLHCKVNGLPGWVTLPQACPAHHARLRGNVFAAAEFLFGFIANQQQHHQN